MLTIARCLDDKTWTRSEKAIRNKVSLDLQVFIGRIESVKGSAPDYCNVFDWILATLENTSPERIMKKYIPVDLLEEILSPAPSNTTLLGTRDFNFSDPISTILEDMASKIQRFSVSALSQSEFGMWHMSNTEDIQYLATLTQNVSDIQTSVTFSKQQPVHFLLNIWDPRWVIYCNTKCSNNVKQIELLKTSCISILEKSKSRSYLAESTVANRINLLNLDIDDDLFRIDMRSMSILDESQVYSVEYLASNNLIQDAEHIWIYKLAKDAHTSCWVGFALISHMVYTLPDATIKTIVQKLML
jgi:hypothetical protein